MVATIVMVIWSTPILMPVSFLGLWGGWQWPVDSLDPVLQGFLLAVPVFCQDPCQENENHSPKAYPNQVTLGVVLVGDT